MQLFVSVIIVASIIIVTLLTLNLILPLDEEKTKNRFDGDEVSIGLTDTLESEMIDIESTNETKTIDSKNDDWKKVVFSEMYDDNGELLEKYNETKIRIYVEDIPEYSHRSITKQVVDDAVASWSEVNPELDFAIVDDIGLSNIDIKWVSNIYTKPTGKITVQSNPVGEMYAEPTSHTLGITETTIMNYGNHEQIHHQIQIDLLNKDCNKQEIFWDDETVTDTIKHEIGHTLGLDHSSDENNLMYGNDGIKNILTKGLSIPEKTTDFHYIGEKEVLEELEIYENKLNVELRSHGWTVEDLESGKVVDNDLFYSRINSIIDDLNSVTDKYNCFLLSGS